MCRMLDTTPSADRFSPFPRTPLPPHGHLGAIPAKVDRGAHQICRPAQCIQCFLTNPHRRSAARRQLEVLRMPGRLRREAPGTPATPE